MAAKQVARPEAEGVDMTRNSRDRRPRGQTWGKVRKRALARDRYTCQKCGSKERTSLTVDHIVPVSRGGARYELGNLMTLCKSCHDDKDRPFNEAGRRPAPKPVLEYDSENASWPSPEERLCLLCGEYFRDISGHLREAHAELMSGLEKRQSERVAAEADDNPFG